ncbi:precorrin-3B synthase [Rhizobium sp. GN54]|uniref:precorrin-3B synthase n=1 Tax=Rhizobium sp. GN54 TaxID=2898150 RepID=UPI001E3BB664|nr:precorrin-3B synthase [Rhizobium sp. GN54]MCD2182542.1 precorrin-3B synthase [Rhizobium sp. GN54]
MTTPSSLPSENGLPSAAQPTPSLRRGACPSLATPMQTGDGLLVRLRPARPSLAPADYIAIARLAADHGNGLLEVTARGNLQLRGLKDDTVQPLAAGLADAGIDFHRGVAVETPALSGLDPDEAADATPLAAAIRQTIAGPLSRLRLAPKLSIVVDGGGRLSLADMVGDIRLDAVRRGGDLFWRLSVGGDVRSARPVAAVADRDALAALATVLRALDGTGPAARGRDLDAGALRGALGTIAVDADFPVLPAFPPSPVGRHVVGTRSVLGIGLPYGATDAATLEGLMRGLASLGATGIRLSPHRALLILGLSAARMDAAAALAGEAGFWTRADAPGNAIAVCAGAAGCASGTFDTKAVADQLVLRAPDLLDGAMTVHVSGCAKGCAHPAPAVLALCGRADGIGMVFDGRSGDRELATLSAEEIGRTMERLAALVRERRLKGETVRQAIERLGAGAIADIVRQGRQ